MQVRIKFIIALLFLSMSISGQVSKSLTIETAGALSTALTATEKATITNLTITGTIDARDIYTMRDSMPSIAVLDISAIQIETYDAFWYVNPANEIPEGAFSFADISKKYSNLKMIALPASISKIGRNAFNSCTGLTSIIIPDRVITNGNGAFWGCSGLESLVIPASVIAIEDVAFAGCRGLKSITLKSSTPLTFGLYNSFQLSKQINLHLIRPCSSHPSL